MPNIVDKVSSALDTWIEGNEAAPHSADPQHDLDRLQTIVRFASLATSISVVAAPLYLQSLGSSGLETGIFFAIGELATALARPLIGRALDRFGRRPFLRVGVAIVFISMALFAIARPFSLGPKNAPFLTTDATYAEVMMFIAKLINGFGMGTMLLASYTVTADLARTGKTAGSFGATEQAQFRGGLYGALIAVPILLANGFNPESGNLDINSQVWTTAFAVYSLGALGAFLFSYRELPETRQLAFAVTDEHEEEHHQNRIDPQLYVLMAIVLFTNFSDGLKIYILRYIREFITTNTLWIGLSYVPSALIWGTLPARMGRIADRFGRKPPMTIGLTASGIFSVTIPLLAILFPNPIIAIVALTLFATLESICYAAAVPAEQALVADMMGGKKRGTGFGLYTLAQTAGKALGPLIMGFLYDIRPSFPFGANAIILIVGGLLVWFALRDPARKPKTS
jgi:MFS family permease